MVLISIQNNNYPVAESLLMHKANPDIQNNLKQTPLHIAARLKLRTISELLKAQGANCEILDELGVKSGYFKAAENTEDSVALLKKKNRVLSGALKLVKKDIIRKNDRVKSLEHTLESKKAKQIATFDRLLC